MKKVHIAFLAIAFAGIIAALVGMFLERPPKVHAASQFATILCDSYKPVSSASNLQLATAGNANMFIYVCGFNFGSIGGSSFSLVEGTGSTCATNTLAVAGGTTAVTGYGIAANGSPVNAGSGVGAIAKTAVAGDNLCVFTSGTGPLAGVVAFTQAPF